MRFIKPLILAALAALPLASIPALAQTSSVDPNGAAATSPARAPTRQQMPAAQGGTNGTGAGESGGSKK